MMVEVGRKFINQFVVKDRRQRLSYELWGKCRQQGIARFCHNARELLIESKIKASGKELHKKSLQGMLPSSYNGQDCYIMAYYETIDGTVCSYEEALKLVLGNGMAAIIIFDGFAVVETEQYTGSVFGFYYTQEDEPYPYWCFYTELEQVGENSYKAYDLWQYSEDMTEEEKQACNCIETSKICEHIWYWCERY